MEGSQKIVPFGLAKTSQFETITGEGLGPTIIVGRPFQSHYLTICLG